MRLFQFDDFRLGAGRGDASIVDITAVVEPTVAPSSRMQALIEMWPTVRRDVEQALASQPAILLTDVTVHAPLTAPRNVIAAPVNYRRHQAEMGGPDGVYKRAEIKTIETYAGFIKASSSVIGPDEPIRLPSADRRVDHEAEIGIVIGRRAASVMREHAMEYVFGFVPLLDITMRGEEDRSFRKSFDTFTPIGPGIVTADEVTDSADISFQLTINGELRQSGNTRDLIYDIPRLVELYSSVITLEPGDLIASGTPQGVAEIQPGDAVALTVEGMGCLEMAVVARSAGTPDRVSQTVPI